MGAKGIGACAALWFALLACNGKDSKPGPAPTPPPATPTTPAPPAHDAGGSVVVPANELHRTAIETLRKAIDERYSYRDRKNLDWDALFAGARAELEAAPTPQAFAARLATMLAPAEDMHIWIDVIGGERVASYPLPTVPNFNPDVLRTIVTDIQRFGTCLASGKLAGGFGYVAILSWERDRCADVVADFPKALAGLADTKGLVIDVRINNGGDENIARTVAQHFVDGPTLYAKREMRDATAPGGFKPPMEVVLKPAAGITRYTKPAVVLIGPVNASSNEGFVLMMRAAKAKLVGEKTRGASGNPQPIDLGNGVTVFLPSWRAMTADGTPFEGIGIAPDVEVKATAEELKTRDPILEKAIELLTAP